MFTGSYFNSIDAKGRAFVPAKLRYSLGERVWLAKGVDGCLNIFTQETWRDYINQYISILSKKDEKARQLKRFILGGSRELEIDRQGRINIPQDLADYACIEKDVAFVGSDDLVELWGAEVYKKEMSPENINPKDLMRGAAETDGE